MLALGSQWMGSARHAWGCGRVLGADEGLHTLWERTRPLTLRPALPDLSPHPAPCPLAAVQSLVSQLLVSSSFGARLVSGVVALWGGQVLWSTAGPNDTAALTCLATRALSPAARAAVKVGRSGDACGGEGEGKGGGAHLEHGGCRESLLPQRCGALSAWASLWGRRRGRRARARAWSWRQRRRRLRARRRTRRCSARCSGARAAACRWVSALH